MNQLVKWKEMRNNIKLIVFSKIFPHTHTHIAQCFEQIKFEKQNKEFVMTNKGDDAMMG